ncbi:hypothetical protein Ciccas_011289 [Cichlidogyrus casuarinus]|uniref:Nitric oxide synthase-interacting protein zinc-finger domain-containing protein n=1 Tax=Cichlidogyrus casuarinus TaxID=1844966 RepID=A0ABD2PSC0_9PLAT
MTRHSKNCTAHSVYTYHERKKDEDKNRNERFGKDSIKPFDCCCLTLQTAKDPVITPDGYLYDKAAILEYIVETKADIQRKLKLYDKQKNREELRIKELENIKKQEQIKAFLDTSAPTPLQHELNSVAREIRTLNNDYRPGTCNDFWAPGQAAQHDGNDKLTETDKPDTIVRCPMSRKPLKFKQLIPVNFVKYRDETASSSNSSKANYYCCAVTKDIITDATPCVVLKTSGSIVKEEVCDKLIKKDMIDPINGKKMTDKDFIPLFRGSLGYTDERVLLKAKRS